MTDRDCFTVKCRFCGYRAAKFSGKSGKKKPTGFDKLRDHVERCHPEEWEKIREYVGEEPTT
jgi:hypothetical protein